MEGWLLGHAGGGAVADVLFGVVYPSSRLAETIPLRLEDARRTSTSGRGGPVLYGSGLFVGYRFYGRREVSVSFPFEYGLSYSSVDYSAATATPTAAGLEVALKVRTPAPGRT
ncbi:MULTISPECIES: glycoside hydrolase family 3 C-terminal domain-containing protein [Rhodococcus]|uniref:glycoside hydrolase family 3 C-terminal domain-containing protein n=1 Tax=Rhodococcus TaxID=1827 RepID=UPI00211C08EB|nr:glycoside hydrolase family 3 C-terminal domain-containing protein [Rhodococcus sp. ACS1]